MAKKRNKPQPFKTVAPEICYPEQIVVVYSNFAIFTISNPDLTIDFGIGHNQKIGDKISSKVQMHTRVIMSPQQAKTFAEKVNGLIEQYEKDFGKIQTEPKTKSDE